MQQYSWPVQSITATNPSVGTNTVTAPASSTEVGFIDGSGNLQGVSATNPLPVSTTPSGTQNVNLTQVNGSAISEGQKAMAASLPVVIASDQSALPTTVASLPLPTGASTSALQTTGNASLTSLDSKAPALGQALAAASVPVVLTAAQVSTLTPLSSVTVTQATGANLHTVIDSGTVTLSGTPAISGTVTANQGTANTAANAWMTKTTDGTNVAAVKAASTAPVASDPALVVSISPNYVDPTYGTVAAGTAGTKSALIGGVYNTTPPTLTNGQQAVLQLDSDGSLRVNVIDPLPAGTNLLGKVGIDQTTPGTTNLVYATTAGSPGPANAPTVTTYGTPITSAAYVTIVASTTSATNVVEIFDSSGVALYFATGAAASEVNQFVIYPGGNGQISLQIPAGTRISYKAVSASATGASAYNVLNLYK